MAGLYLHIPYCYRACTYCNFHFSTNLETKERVLAAMVKEMKLHAGGEKKKIETLYFGGGTPSILSIQEFDFLMDQVKKYFDMNDLLEFTLECNPEDLEEEKMRMWKAQGVDRLSIGVQTFRDEILKSINRQHRREEAIKKIKKAQTLFDKVSIDLIMGLPNSDPDVLKEDVELTLSMDPEHISAYQLSLENKTALAYDVKMGKIKLLDEEEINEQYRVLDGILVSKGYIHYEVSNFAKKGKEAIHNSSYWEGKSYIGIGPGAHSFFNNERRWNVSNNIQYAKKIEIGESWYESEELTEKDRFNEMIMISLRTNKGLSIRELSESFPELVSDEVKEKAQLWEKKGWAKMIDERVYLTVEGWLISDHLASDLFLL